MVKNTNKKYMLTGKFFHKREFFEYVPKRVFLCKFQDDYILSLRTLTKQIISSNLTSTRKIGLFEYKKIFLKFSNSCMDFFRTQH